MVSRGVLHFMSASTCLWAFSLAKMHQDEHQYAVSIVQANKTKSCLHTEPTEPWRPHIETQHLLNLQNCSMQQIPPLRLCAFGIVNIHKWRSRRSLEG